MAFPPHFLEELRGRLSLAALIGRSVRLTRRGREHLGLCPFHNEKTPSFTVNEEKGFYHCFGCGAHGDALGFVMQSQHLSFPEAVESLAAEAGLTPPAPTPEEREKEKRRASLHDAIEAACTHFQRQLRLPAGRAGLSYLLDRGLDDDSIERFRLGFAPDSRRELKTALTGQGLGEALLVEAGLLIQSDSGETYDRFRGRVMFPIGDRQGRVIAFGGRVLGDGQPKYLNSPDTPLFNKGTVLYGVTQARAPAAQAGAVLVVEGYMDVIALNRAGFANAVAPLGTALTEGQIEGLWRLASEVVLCFDGDAAGLKAACRATERALPTLRAGRGLRFAFLPPGDDPDSLIRRRGAAALEELLGRAQPMSEVLWRMVMAGRALRTPEEKAAVRRDAREWVSRIADEELREALRRDFDDRLWRGGARERIPRRRPRGDGKDRQTRLPGLQPPPPPSSAERLQEQVMLAVLVNHPQLIDTVGERLGEVAFAEEDLDKLRQEILKHLGDIARLDSPILQDYLRRSGFERVLDSLVGARMVSQFSFTRPDASPKQALAGWEDAFRRHQMKEFRADTVMAEERLAREATQDSLDRFLAYKDQEATHDLDAGAIDVETAEIADRDLAGSH